MAQWRGKAASLAADAAEYFGDVAETLHALLVEALEEHRCVVLAT